MSFYYHNYFLSQSGSHISWLIFVISASKFNISRQTILFIISNIGELLLILIRLLVYTCQVNELTN